MAKSWDPFGDSWSFRNFDWNVEKSHFPGGAELEAYGRAVSDDIFDRLPVDPFGMDIKSRFSAVKGWIGVFEADFGDVGDDDGEKKFVGDGLFSGFDWFLNDGVRLQSQSNINISSFSIHDNIYDLGIDCEYGDFGSKIDFDNVILSSKGKASTRREECDANACSVSTDGCSPHSLGIDSIFNVSSGVVFDEEKECEDKKGGEPPDGFDLVLSYLGVRELLVVEMVSKSLRDVVRDNSLWKKIYIDQPLSEKITDDVLGKLAGRAQGTLQSLTLVGCTKISDTGLMRVLESNLSLQKLSVPRCLRLTVDGIVGILRALKSAGTLKLKHLRFGCFVGVTDHQFEELSSILGAEMQAEQISNKKKPQFYHVGQFYLSCDDDRAFDIERCPKCQKLKLIYDCPLEGCQVNDQAASQLCRACTQCIPRCIHCGQCIRDRDYEETFTLDHLCLVCRKELQTCDEKHEMKSVSSSGSIIFVDK
ncbi:unnamed protein product [Linum trigynum]|uniref:F-box domain-containing protein n=1 Tax=Linum trigynum TaxID=586398 RepID=A0AAV2F1C9_9ROSI